MSSNPTYYFDTGVTIGSVTTTSIELKIAVASVFQYTKRPAGAKSVLYRFVVGPTQAYLDDADVLSWIPNGTNSFDINWSNWDTDYDQTIDFPSTSSNVSGLTKYWLRAVCMFTKADGSYGYGLGPCVYVDTVTPANTRVVTAQNTPWVLSANTTKLPQNLTAKLTVAPGGMSYAQETVITLTDGDGGGTFSPSASITFAAGSTAPVTVVYTPSVIGSHPITGSGNYSITSPSALTMDVTAPIVLSTAYTLTQSTQLMDIGTTIQLSVQPNNDGPGEDVVIMLHDEMSGGTFSSTSVTLPMGSNAAQTVNYTPNNAGTYSLWGICESGVLTDPGGAVVYPQVPAAGLGTPTVTTEGVSDPTTGFATLNATFSNFMLPVTLTFSRLAEPPTNTVISTPVNVASFNTGSSHTNPLPYSDTSAPPAEWSYSTTVVGNDNVSLTSAVVPVTVIARGAVDPTQADIGKNTYVTTASTLRKIDVIGYWPSADASVPNSGAGLVSISENSTKFVTALATIEPQGQTSATQSFRMSAQATLTTAKGKTANVKFGDWYVDNKFNIKGYPRDSTYIRDMTAYDIWREMVFADGYEGLPVPESVRASAYGKPNSALMNAQWGCNSWLGWLTINGIDYGLVSWNNRFNKRLYAIDDTNPTHALAKIVTIDWNTPSMEAFDFKVPKTVTDTVQTAWLAPLNYLRDLNAGNAAWSDVGKYWDLRTLRDYLIFSELTLNGDGLVKNGGLRMYDDGVMYYCPYDLDETAGVNWNLGYDATVAQGSITQGTALLGMLWTNDLDNIKKRYAKLRDLGVLSKEKVWDIIRSRTSFLDQDLLAKSQSLWPCETNDTLSQTVDAVYNAYSARLDFLDQTFDYNGTTTVLWS